VVGRKGGFLTATVSDLPIQPQKVVFISNNFFFLFFSARILAFTIRPFWLLLFKFWLLLFKKVYPISAPEYRFSLSSQFFLLFNLLYEPGAVFHGQKDGFTAAKLKKSFSAPEYRFSLSSQKGFLYPNSGFLYPNHGIITIYHFVSSASYGTSATPASSISTQYSED